MFKYVVMVCSLVCLLSATPLWAAEALVGNFTYYGFGDKLQIVVKNENSFRMNIIEDGAEDIFMLMDNGKRWLIGRDTKDSDWEAVDFEGLTQLVAEMHGASDDHGKAVITKSGVQTVADIAGESFNAKYDDDTFDLILSQNADIVTLTKAMFMFFKDIDDDGMKLMISTVTQINKESNNIYGLLQYADDFVFTSLERQNFTDSYFAFPKDVKMLDLAEMFDE